MILAKSRPPCASAKIKQKNATAEERPRIFFLLTIEGDDLFSIFPENKKKEPLCQLDHRNLGKYSYPSRVSDKPVTAVHV
jgi:hypothetical protein